MANELNPLDQRKGVAFQDPVSSTGNLSFFYNKHFPNWGVLVSPDEQRYVTLFGNRLQAPDSSQTITDEVLFDYEVRAIGIVERTYHIDLMPRIVLTQNRPDANGIIQPRDPTTLPPDIKAMIDLMDEDQIERYVLYETGYPYRRPTASKYMKTNLQRRPLQRIFAGHMIQPDGTVMVDLMRSRIETRGLRSYVQFMPAAGVYATMAPYILNGQSFVQAAFPFPYDDFPDAIRFDYLTGWQTARRVPHDLREIVRMIAGIMLMEDYGDGKGGGLAGASANFNSVSESYQTTDSATSGTYGPRIKDFQKELQRLDKAAGSYYKRNTLAVLG